MTEIIAKLRAALDDDERAIDAYEAHRAAEGRCVNFEGQDPADYTQFDSCAVHIATYKVCRYGDMGFGRRQVAAIRKILDLHQRYPNPYNTNESACSSCDEYRYETWFSDDQGCPTVLALAEAYGIEVQT